MAASIRPTRNIDSYDRRLERAVSPFAAGCQSASGIQLVLCDLPVGKRGKVRRQLARMDEGSARRLAGKRHLNSEHRTFLFRITAPNTSGSSLGRGAP